MESDDKFLFYMETDDKFLFHPKKCFLHYSQIEKDEWRKTHSNRLKILKRIKKTTTKIKITIVQINLWIAIKVNKK